MILFPLTVKIRVQICCATNPNPHSRLETSETVVITGQGTQACGDELVITGTSGRTPQDTQDTQGGSHEMVVTSGTREAVEPVYHSREEQKASKKQVLEPMQHATHKEF